jgi:hypothetical protein
MKVFVSYAFNGANKWIEDLAIPLAKALGFEVVTGQRIEGQPLAEAVDKRLRDCTGCVAFTTRRGARVDGSYETHPWVISEMQTARALGFKTVEVREDGVKIGDDSEAYVRLRYKDGARDKLLIDLADVLARWIIRPVRVQLLPPTNAQRKFIVHVLGGGNKCSYQLLSGGRTIATGEAVIQPNQFGGFFVDIEVPREEVLVQLEIKRSNNSGAWKSLGNGLNAIPVQLY